MLIRLRFDNASQISFFPVFWESFAFKMLLQTFARDTISRIRGDADVEEVGHGSSKLYPPVP